MDEITKEKQRVGEALARFDGQREKLIGQLGELEAAERVLARYGEGTRARRSAAAKAPMTGRKADRSSAITPALPHCDRKTSR